MTVVVGVLASGAGPGGAETGPVTATCSPDGAVALTQGDPLALTLTYVNGSSVPVEFTPSTSANIFLGPAPKYPSIGVAAGATATQPLTFDTYTMPPGRDRILVTVTSSATGTTPIATCDVDLLLRSNPDADTDRDGLLDTWETDGIDYDRDGAIDLALGSPPYNADPYHRDLFLELDWMAGSHSHAPAAGAVEDVAAAYAAAPLPNPDGTTGITLHAFVDEAVQEVTPVRFTTRGSGPYDDFDDIKTADPDAPCDGAFGTAADRAAPNCDRILGAKRLIFRYGIFAHDYAERIRSSGIAELPGNDLLVTLGGWTPTEISAAGGQRAAEAGTLMHELGHTLGLDHGGFDSVNCKPNYLSVMSYSLQFPSIDRARPLDYSRTRLPSLAEASLSEGAGIGGPAGRLAVYGVGGASRTAPADGPIDWNGDGDAHDAAVTADVNRIDSAGCGASAAQTLHGHDDWAGLIYDFRYAATFADGASAREERDELDAETVLEAALAADYDGDAVANERDNCPDAANPAQDDADRDGAGDACDERFDGTAGKVTGGGSVDGGSFSLSVASDDLPGASIVLATGAGTVAVFRAVRVDGIAVFGREATIVGTGSWPGGLVTPFRLDVADLGEPGRGVDRFTLRIGTAAALGGVLRGGNVQLHR